MTRIEREKATVEKMIHIYCRHKEHNEYLCADCTALLEYARFRLSKCPFGEHKTTCLHCKIHCYKPEMKARIAAVMRYAGPRMLFYHPLSAVRHLISK